MAHLVEDLDLVIDGDAQVLPELLDSVGHFTSVAHADELLVHAHIEKNARKIAAGNGHFVALLVLILEDLLDAKPAFLKGEAAHLQSSFLEVRAKLVTRQLADVGLDLLGEAFTESLADEPVVWRTLVNNEVIFILLCLQLETVELLGDVLGNFLEVLKGVGIVVNDSYRAQRLLQREILSVSDETAVLDCTLHTGESFLDCLVK